MNNSGLSEMLSKLSEETGVSDAELMRFAALIARQETESTGMDPASVQTGYGQGRGMFQFESPHFVKKGGAAASESAKTAINRLKNFYKVSGLKAPDWVATLNSKTDPAKLTAEQQYMLFFADKMPTANVVNPITKKKEMQFGFSPLAEVGTETFNPVDWWAKYHKRAAPSVDDTSRFKRILTNIAGGQPKQVAAVPQDELFGNPNYLRGMGGYTDIT